MTRGLGLTLLAAGCIALAPPPAAERGVPLELAETRARTIADVRYDLAFRVPEHRADAVTGTVVVRFRVLEPTDPLTLDFAGEAIARHTATVDGIPVEPRWENGHLLFDRLEVGAHEVSIGFTASDLPLNRHDDFLYSLFVPARAHEVFPCFDQPDLKARVTLTLDVPEGWQTVANGATAGRRVDDNRAVVRFEQTSPLPTYLVAFAAGRFFVETAERNGRPFRVLHRETDVEVVTRNRQAIFDLHASALAWLEDYTDLPYPWGKFDIVLLPGFQFGGMEHAGAVFYRQDSLLLGPSPTQNQRLGRASVIAHEAAHMWFGNLVTMRWFNDVWMKEVLANFLAAKVVNPSFPDVNHDLRFYLAHYRPAYDVDRTRGTHPVRQPLDNLSDAGTLYGPIIYQKAPILLRQLERLVGPDALQEGLRAYLAAHAFASATWPDLIAILDDGSPTDLAAWSETWVERPGRPTIATEMTVEGERISGLQLTQRDSAGEPRAWPQAIEVEVGGADRTTRLPVSLTEPVTGVPGAVGLRKPQYILPSGGGWAYGDVVLPPETRDWLLTHLPELRTALSRGVAWGTLWEASLEGRIPTIATADLALRLLDTERDELNIQRVLSDFETLYWRLVPTRSRAALGPRAEASFRRALDAAERSGLKRAWFGALTRIGSSAAHRTWLTDLWRGDAEIPGLELGEEDFTDLAFQLALREVPGWSEILDTQHDRITNPDRRARFAFIRPALHADPRVRATFLAGLAEAAQRRREPWVITALRYLHHPLRAEASAALVRPGLDLLTDIRRTGDIFFPSRWLTATLEGHRSATVAASVVSFLAARPGYPEPLRRLVLQAADPLLRVSSWEVAAP